MLPVRLLRKHLPNSPDWLIGGVLLVSIFWLIVLPIEIYNFYAGQDFYVPANVSELASKSLYLKGYLLSISWTPLIKRFFEGDQAVVSIIMLLGMLISSPGYFLTGALLATRKTLASVSGVLLVGINIFVNFYLLLGLAILLSG